jgi:hypothetical protein
MLFDFDLFASSRSSLAGLDLGDPNPDLSDFQSLGTPSWTGPICGWSAGHNETVSVVGCCPLEPMLSVIEILMVITRGSGHGLCSLYVLRGCASRPHR